MIAEIGHFALVLALCVTLVQSIIPLIGAQRGNMAWMEAGRAASLVQFILVTVSFGALTYAYVVSDFSLANVAQNSHTLKPMLYKVTGVWGNHEGSLLLWALILAIFGLAVSLFGDNLPPTLKARALAVQAMVSFGFIGFLLFTSNPFIRLTPAPANGSGLNPLLQDPGLAFHPPFLYLGYVGFSMAFSFAIAALIEGKVDAAWARWVRPWTLAAWVFLTAGIALGSWWAYYELGWGGWWYWDPVENASFMPWLVGTALLHSAIVVERRDTLKSWTILLAIVTFSLSLLGTFLVRSGVINSVHSFASDPARGLYILAMLVVVIGGSLMLYAVRAPTLKSGGIFAPVSREGSLLLNNLLMSTAAGTVLLGTLYPLFVDALGAGKVSVGPPFFNMVFLPLMAPMVATMAIGPLLSWKRGDYRGALSRLWLAMIAAVACAAIGWLLGGGAVSTLAVMGGLGLGGWLFVGALIEFAERIQLFRAPFAVMLKRLKETPGSAWGMTVSHIGLAFIILGITGSSAWQVEKIQNMKVGDAVNVSGYEFKLTEAKEGRGPNYSAMQGTFVVSLNGKEVVTLKPEKRLYVQPPRPTTEADIHTTLWADLYAVIGDSDGQGGYVTRLYRNPLVSWLWIGSLTLMIGGLIALFDRRHRVGAPAKKGAKP